MTETTIRKADEKSRQACAPLFEGWEESVIWSCLQGVMGEIYVNDPEHPASAMAILGDFCYFAGTPDRELVSGRPERYREKDFMIMVPQNDAWGELIEECLGTRVKKVLRYAIKKEPGIFDEKTLRAAVDKLPPEYTLNQIDRDLFERCPKLGWCRDWVAQYENYEQFLACGLGFVVEKDGEPVAGASSYSGFRGGIEIEIDTKEEYRRKGLASVCGAALILECIRRGWYPSWDAQNLWSVALAEKLGYHYSHDYPAYETDWKDLPLYG